MFKNTVSFSKHYFLFHIQYNLNNFYNKLELRKIFYKIKHKYENFYKNVKQKICPPFEGRIRI